ncbi:MAG: translation initiation factor IF-2, partial [Bacteroidota bacterium]
MAKRLIKVAKELNVGTSTIVDFLNGNGFEIENKPTAKISGDMELMLQKEFQKSFAIKEKANQIKIGRNLKKEEEQVEQTEAPTVPKAEPITLAPPTINLKETVAPPPTPKPSVPAEDPSVITAKQNTPTLQKI